MKKIFSKKLLLLMVVLFNTVEAFAQDKITMLNGEMREGKILAVRDDAVKFVYKGETLEYEFKKADICKEKNVTLITELKSRNRYFFFRRTNFVKTKRFDRIIDAKGNIVKEIMMKSETKGDESLFRKFHRLVIIDNEIHEVICKIGNEKGKVILYNFCGEQLREMEMKAEELYDKYSF